MRAPERSEPQRRSPSVSFLYRVSPARRPLQTRGIAAMVTGFLEVPGNMYAMTEDRGLGWGVSLGLVQGLGMIVVRELVGVYEFLTCPLEIPAASRR